MSEATIVIQRNENPDSLEVGTPSRGGSMKVYGDFSDKEAFKKKIDNAIDVRKYANVEIEKLGN